MKYTLSLICKSCKEPTTIFTWQNLRAQKVVVKYRGLRELIAKKNRCPKNPAHSLVSFSITDSHGDGVTIAEVISNLSSEDTITT